MLFINYNKEEEKGFISFICLVPKKISRRLSMFYCENKKKLFSKWKIKFKNWLCLTMKTKWSCFSIFLWIIWNEKGENNFLVLASSDFDVWICKTIQKEQGGYLQGHKSKNKRKSSKSRKEEDYHHQ